METLFGIAIGIGLSAACGFRVFVPLLVMNLMALSGHLHLSSGFAWIASLHATVAFATATVLEVLGYYIPWVDHALDTVATPAAVVAGMLATASMADLSPFLKWTLALMAGGGVAGLVQGGTAALRLKSSLLTAGAGNPLLSTLELAGAAVTALLAVLAPILCLVLVGLFCLFAIRRAGRLILGRKKRTPSR
ncbi:MAG TPA: DUF4126 domain-containing protein [Syntrophales bacterium]|nr:DUF4126 domain-containing protein [Syntrophales bacterium]HOS77092.1 DUF4126 domain-containing protein [Syntrophales bacterium]